jgi:hypothetical protein
VPVTLAGSSGLSASDMSAISGLANKSEGGGDFKLTLVTNGTPQNVVSYQRVAPDEWAMIVEDAVQKSLKATEGQIGDPNSKMSRRLSRNIKAERIRS